MLRDACSHQNQTPMILASPLILLTLFLKIHALELFTVEKNIEMERLSENDVSPSTNV